MEEVNAENIVELMDSMNFGNSITNGMPNAGPYIKENIIFGYINTSYSQALKYKITLSQNTRPHKVKLAPSHLFNSVKWFNFKTMEELTTYVAETIVSYE